MSELSIGKRVISSRYLLWSALAAPGVYWALAYGRGTIFYGETVHATGDLAIQLLLLTLLLTPLGMWFPKTAWIRWLKAKRRYLGIASFGYGLLHTVVYLQRRADLARILDDALEIAMWTGWLALLVMAVLALTSNNYSVARLGRRWKQLHRLAHPIAALVLLHWILSAFDPTTAYSYLAVFVALECFRLWLRQLARRKQGRVSTAGDLR